MYWFLILMAGLLVVLAAKRRFRRRLRVIRVNTKILLSTLADKTMITGDLIGSVAEEVFILSADLMVSMTGHTAGEGPLQVGIAHGDYTVTELKEWFESTDVLNGDKIEEEESRRLSRDIGVLSGVGTDEAMNDGKPRRVKMKFRVSDGESLNGWVYNNAGGALSTGTGVTITGKIYCVNQ